MNLSVTERLVMLSILPQEGDITTIKIVLDMKDVLSFDEHEHSVLQFRDENGMTMWETAGEMTKDVTFAPRAYMIVTNILEKLDKEQKITADHITLCDKFLNDEGRMVLDVPTRIGDDADQHGRTVSDTG